MKPVDHDRRLKLTFNQPMNYTRLEAHNISLANLKVVQNKNNIVPAVELVVFSRYGKEEIANTSSPMTFSANEIQMSVNFVEWSIISMRGPEKDKLFVKINSLEAFVSLRGIMVSADSNSTYDDSLARQNYIEVSSMLSSGTMKTFLEKVLPNAVLGASYLSIILNYLANSSLSTMLIAIADLSLLLHHLLLPVVMAPFLRIYTHKIMKLVSFDPIPVDD